jgi:hypothetical protein
MTRSAPSSTGLCNAGAQNSCQLPARRHWYAQDQPAPGTSQTSVSVGVSANSSLVVGRMAACHLVINRVDQEM